MLVHLRYGYFGSRRAKREVSLNNSYQRVFDPNKFSKACLIIMNDHKRLIYLYKENVIKFFIGIQQ